MRLWIKTFRELTTEELYEILRRIPGGRHLARPDEALEYKADAHLGRQGAEGDAGRARQDGETVESEDNTGIDSQPLGSPVLHRGPFPCSVFPKKSPGPVAGTGIDGEER